MKIKFDLAERFHSDTSFYRQPEERISLCCGAAWGFLRDCNLPISPSISVEARSTNPRKKYWRKAVIDTKSDDIKVIGKSYQIHWRMKDFLEGFGLYNNGQALWVKITPRN